jgi:hypothetical protein
VLKAQGSFFVGGDKVEQSRGELGDLGPGGHIAVNQMYVRYMVPQGGEGNVPVVMVHGATLTGKSWETTPDGRMGWDEYFVRKGHPCTSPTRSARAIGLQPGRLQQRARGLDAAANLPVWLRFSDESVWPNFRFGRTLASRSPTASSRGRGGRTREAGRARRQLSAAVPTPNPTLKALSDLAGQLNGAGADGATRNRIVSLESALLKPARRRSRARRTGQLPARYTPSRSRTLANGTDLVVFGDHRDNPTGLPTCPHGRRVSRLVGTDRPPQECGGQAEMLRPAGARIRGNSHMNHARQETICRLPI